MEQVANIVQSSVRHQAWETIRRSAMQNIGRRPHRTPEIMWIGCNFELQISKSTSALLELGLRDAPMYRNKHIEYAGRRKPASIPKVTGIRCHRRDLCLLVQPLHATMSMICWSFSFDALLSSNIDPED